MKKIFILSLLAASSLSLVACEDNDPTPAPAGNAVDLPIMPRDVADDECPREDGQPCK